jgi:tetratricopeptide (TPR) repeat protein
MTTCSTDDLDKAIQLARDEDSVSKDGSDRPKKLSRLAQLLNDKHDAVNTGPISERSRIAEIVLDEAIPVAEEALGLIAEHSPDRPEYLRDLATYYVSRFEDKRKMSDLNRAVELMRKAIDIDHTDRIRDVSRLAEYLGRRSKASGYSDSLDNSEDDSSTTEDSDNFSDEDEDLETDTSPTSRAREPIDADADIDEAIQLAQDVLYTTPDKGPARAEYLNNLANHYAYRYKAKHTIKDLKRAIDLVRKAVKTTEGVRDQAKYLHRLAVHLECMFNETVTADTLHSASKGSQTSAKARAPLDYLDEAVKLAQVAVDLTPNEDLDRARYLEGLAGHLFSRSYGRRSMDDLDKAIAVAREALRVIPEGHYTRPRYLHKPSGYLIQRWEIIHRREVTNTTVDLEEAIRLGGEALKGTAMFPKPELDRYIEIQDDLSQLLISRFERTRRKAGLKAALLEYLDKATLDDEKERPQLAAPSDEPTGNKASGAGKEPTDHNQDDIEASPNKKTGQAGRPQHQVDASHNQEAAVVLDRKIKLALATVNNMQDDDPNRSSHLSTLADALASRYEVVKNVDDLDKSIEIMRETVGLAADNYQEKPKHLSSLANLLVQRYEATNPSVDSEMGTESSGSSGEETSDTEGLNHSLDTDGETMEPEHSDGAEEGSECSEETTNNTSDLDEAIQLMRDAVEMLPKEHPDLPRYLNCLASYLADRYKDTEGTDYDSDVQSHGTEDLAESGDERVSADEEDSADGEDGADEDEANDLDEAIQLWQEAIDASGIARHDRAEYVDNLIKHLIYRYDSMNDLEEAVRLLEDEVKNTGLDYSDRPAILKRIGDHLDSIWDATEDDGLNTKIRIRQDALNVTPEDLPDRAKFLDELASNFSSRYERKGSRGDLEAAIQLGRNAIKALPS